MKKQEQLGKLFSDLFDGTPWIDVNIMSTLDEITAKEAATKPFPDFNSIWEIVNHMISWRDTVLKRLQGETIESPDDNYFSFIRDRSESAWKNTKERLRESQLQWLKTIRKMTGKELDVRQESNPFSNYELAHGILQHDSYHLGQIRLVKKLVRFT
jgi:uncharacterized damage-inducible protein DinB